jgi:hypothetical protein
MMSTIHEAFDIGKNTVERIRKRPTSTSTSAKTARAPFGSLSRKKMVIPGLVDDYNHKMNGVDQAD